MWACETCGQSIEKRRGIWQHTASRLIGCRGADGYPIDGHAYPTRWRGRITAGGELWPNCTCGHVEAVHSPCGASCGACDECDMYVPERSDRNAGDSQNRITEVCGPYQSPEQFAGEFHKQGECGGDCSGCCNEAELSS